MMQWIEIHWFVFTLTDLNLDIPVYRHLVSVGWSFGCVYSRGERGKLHRYIGFCNF